MKNPIRVLHVLGELNRGGAETMVMNLYRNIDRTKLQFDFVKHTSYKCDYDDEIIDLGGKIHIISRYNGLNHNIYKKEWYNLLKGNPGYKILHGHMRSTASIYLNIGKRLGLITISHSHSTSSGSGVYAIVKNILQYRIRNIADYFFACSKSAGEWLFGKEKCQSEYFYILNNAIDAKQYRFNSEIREKKRKELGIGGKLVIGHVGRFHPSKNHIFLVEIFKEIYNRNADSVLMLVGDGELYHTLNEKVKRLGLEKNVIFTGVRSDIPELLQAMDVFVFPSLYEGLGMALIEAQAAGLPCVVADTIPREAFITNLIKRVPLESKLSVWADQILECAVNTKRIDTYEEIVRSNYDIKSVAKWLEDFYLKLI